MKSKVAEMSRAGKKGKAVIANAVFEKKRAKHFSLMDDYRHADLERGQAKLQEEIDDEF